MCDVCRDVSLSYQNNYKLDKHRFATKGPESKRQSIKRNALTVLQTKVPDAVVNKQVILTVFWNIKSPITVDLAKL